MDRWHPLVRLAGLIDWSRFEAAFRPLYTDATGRPGLPTRLMAGLLYGCLAGCLRLFR